MIKIETFQHKSAFFELEKKLEGKLFKLAFNYNFREDAWRMDISSISGAVYGVLLRYGVDFFAAYRAPAKIKGSFTLINESEDNGLTYDNFGNGFNLYYLDEGEL